MYNKSGMREAKGRNVSCTEIVSLSQVNGTAYEHKATNLAAISENVNLSVVCIQIYVIKRFSDSEEGNNNHNRLS